MPRPQEEIGETSRLQHRNYSKTQSTHGWRIAIKKQTQDLTHHTRRVRQREREGERQRREKDKDSEREDEERERESEKGRGGESET